MIDNKWGKLGGSSKKICDKLKGLPFAELEYKNS